MIRNLSLILFFGACVTTQAQKFVAEKSFVSFYSKATIEDITAENTKAQSIFNTATGDVVFIIPIQEFQFAKSLMKEHFNEKYMETEKYYDATFTGTIIEEIDFTQEGTYDIRAKGNLTIHGKKQSRSIPGKITIEKGTLRIDCTFTVPLADHDIKVPQIVTEKIATEIFVKLNVLMIQK